MSKRNKFTVVFLLIFTMLFRNVQVFAQSSLKDYVYFSTVRSLLKVKDLAPDYNKKGKYSRFGRNYDGGYVMFDDFDSNSIAYSFGIADDDSWESSIANKGIDVFMYDPTIKGLPNQNSKFHFEKLGITGSKRACNMRTMNEFILRNGHKGKKNLILKMDVEGAEWDFLNEVSEETLNQFSQIVLELHWFDDRRLFDDIISGLEKLNKTHQIVHVHANNCVGVNYCFGLMMPQVIEVTCLRKSSYKFVDSNKNFPTELDLPNNPGAAEINLGFWNEEPAVATYKNVGDTSKLATREKTIVGAINELYRKLISL